MGVELFDTPDHVLDRIAKCNDGPPTDDRKLIVAEIE